MDNMPKETLLPYVSSNHIAPAPPIELTKKKRDLSVLAFIASITALVLFFFVFPSVLGIILGVVSLILALKHGRSKVLPVVSLVISSISFVLGAVAWVALLSTFSTPAAPYVPPAFSYDSYDGVAYKYDPVNNIPCDINGECIYNVTLMQIDENTCQSGGVFVSAMQDLQTGVEVASMPYEFPPLKIGEPHKIQIAVYGMPNGRINPPAGADPILCLR